MYKLIVLFAVLAISSQVLAKPHPGMVAGLHSLRPSGYLSSGVHDATVLDTRGAEFKRRENAAVRVSRSLQDASSKSSSSDESSPSVASPESPESVESRQSSASSESSESSESSKSRQ
ncbi:uncharacterized protein LOC124294814 [Neodiprion lecontei]|uniref:Uncharacterized protein LOC124294814 n=1 Tax=Neodiprion lecontei TaxID=441921 RepID=A0ABM3GCR5_NEOLC|nr:uncharacterized protein LOC124294814 [Neodiprion lecontei]